MFNDCADKQDVDIVEELIQVYPEALTTADGGGFIPLHRAVHRKAPNLNVLKLLLRYAPESAMVKTTNGNLPLHWAVHQDYPTLEVVKLIYNAYPSAVHVANRNKETPLDLLLKYPNQKKVALDYIMSQL